MKVIVIEGTDNTGKDTLINSIYSVMNNSKVIHCSTPKSKNNEEAAKEQDKSFNDYADAILNNLDKNETVIFNRAWYGEYVYGPIYRDRKPDDVAEMILKIEKKLENVDITYIQLLSKNIDLLVKNDDNKSLSHGKKELITLERDKFTDIFNKSILRKKRLIYVNDENGEFRPKDVILKESLEAINDDLRNEYIKCYNDEKYFETKCAVITPEGLKPYKLFRIK